MKIYIRESWNKGLTKETDKRIKKLSEKLKGRKITWSKKISKTRKKLFKEGKIKLNSGNFKKGRVPYNKNRILHECECCGKVREMNLSRAKRTKFCDNCKFKGDRNCNSIPGVREKKSKALKGRIFTEETKRKMSENHPDMAMEKNPAWLGGKSFEPYGLDFNNDLKNVIRNRDNFKCRLCNKIQKKRKLSVHHIDYNKKNNDLKNLIALCLSCHMKTNCDRKSWKSKLNKLQEIKQ